MSAVQELQGQCKHQHVYRVKRIAEILEPPAVVSLPPAVQPDGDERQQRKALLADLKRSAEQLHRVHQAAQHLDIEPVQREQLPCQAPPCPTTEEVENQHRQHADSVVIDHAEDPQHRPRQNDADCGRRKQGGILLSAHRFQQMHPQKAHQQRPDHILVYRVKPCPAAHQIERDLGQHGENQHPQCVLPEAVGVEVPLHRHKGKDGVSQSACTGQPLLRRQQRGPEVVHQHKGHSQNVQARRADVKAACAGGKVFLIRHTVIPLQLLLCGAAASVDALTFDCDLYHAVPFVFKQVVGLLDPAQGVSVGDERFRIQLALCDEAQRFLTVAAIDTARLEGQVLAVHLRQRQGLRRVIQRDHRHDGVGSCTLPRKAEGGGCACDLQNHIGAAVRAVGLHKGSALLRCDRQHLGIMLPQKADAAGVLFADDDPLRLFEHNAEQGAYSRRSGADDEDGILLGDLRDARRPVAGGEDITHQQRLPVCHAVRDPVQPGIGKRHPHIFGLPAVNAAAECPAAVFVSAVVHIALFAEEALPAEGLDIDRHAIPRLYMGHRIADGLDDAHHLMADRDAGYGAGHAAVLDVQIT